MIAIPVTIVAIIGGLLAGVAHHLAVLFNLRKKEKAARLAAQFNVRLDQVIKGGKQ